MNSKVEDQAYVAFVSYSHSDEAVAKWLHAALENWRVPAGLGQELAGRKRLGRVFRDRAELSAGRELSGEINAAIKASRHLIVLCSPKSAKSGYVQSEIEAFIALDGPGRIIPVIVEGDPPDCYPQALRQRPDLLGADLRSGRDGRQAGLTKIIAGILALPFDRLAEREKVARRRKLVTGGAVAGAVVLTVAATTGLWLVSAQEERGAKVGEAIETARLAFADGKTTQGLEQISLAIALGGGDQRAAIEQVSSGWSAGYPSLSTLLANRTSNIVTQGAATFWINGDAVSDLNLRGDVRKIEENAGARGVAWNQTGQIRFFGPDGIKEFGRASDRLPLVAEVLNLGQGRYIVFGVYPSGSIGSSQPVALLFDLNVQSVTRVHMSAAGHQATPSIGTNCERLVLLATADAVDELAEPSTWQFKAEQQSEALSFAVPLSDFSIQQENRSSWCNRWQAVKVEALEPFALSSIQPLEPMEREMDGLWPDAFLQSIEFSGNGAFLIRSEAPADSFVNWIDQEFDPFGFQAIIVDHLLFEGDSVQIVGGPPGGTGTGTLSHCFVSLQSRAVSHCHQSDNYLPISSELAPGGETIFVGDQNGAGLVLADARTLNPIPVSEDVDQLSRGAVRSTVSFSPNGKRFFGLSPADGALVWYDLSGSLGSADRRAVLSGATSVPAFGASVTARTQGMLESDPEYEEFSKKVAGLTIRIEAIDERRVLLVRGDGSTALFDSGLGRVLWRGAGTGRSSSNSHFAINRDRSIMAIAVNGALQIISVETGLPVSAVRIFNFPGWVDEVASTSGQRLGQFRMDEPPLRFDESGLFVREGNRVLFIPLRSETGSNGLDCLFPSSNIGTRQRENLADESWRIRCGLDTIPALKSGR